ITAAGPKVGALAGEVADGVILSIGADPKAIETAIGWLDEGLERSGRTRADVKIVINARLSLMQDVEREAERLKPVACMLARGAGRKVLEAAGVELGDASDIYEDVYPTLAHAEDWDEAIRVASTVISDEAALVFAERFGLFGDIEEIGRRIEAIEALGVDEL